MTSLIDVIFLLLLFFMLSSTFSKFSDVELVASAGQGARAADKPPVFLQLGVDTVTVNASELPFEGLADALLGHVEEAGGEVSVVVALKGEVTAQRLTDLLVVLNATQGVRPTLLGGA